MAPPAADEEGMGPLERGRRRYQQKDYSGALSAFTEVCGSCMSFSLVISVFSASFCNQFYAPSVTFHVNWTRC
jgi:hypothetical protein